MTAKATEPIPNPASQLLLQRALCSNAGRRHRNLRKILPDWGALWDDAASQDAAAAAALPAAPPPARPQPPPSEADATRQWVAQRPLSSWVEMFTARLQARRAASPCRFGPACAVERGGGRRPRIKPGAEKKLPLTIKRCCLSQAQHLQLGFELELYAPSELPMIYWRAPPLPLSPHATSPRSAPCHTPYRSAGDPTADSPRSVLRPASPPTSHFQVP